MKVILFHGSINHWKDALYSSLAYVRPFFSFFPIPFNCRKWLKYHHPDKCVNSPEDEMFLKIYSNHLKDLPAEVSVK